MLIIRRYVHHSVPDLIIQAPQCSHVVGTWVCKQEKILYRENTRDIDRKNIDNPGIIIIRLMFYSYFYFTLLLSRATISV